MNNFFIDETTLFLEGSDLSLHPKVLYRSVTSMGETGEQLNFSLARSSVNKLRGNVFLVQSIFFTLMDAIIDQKYPNYEGQSFLKRYNVLQTTSTYDLIFKEVYRLLKTIRNAVVHKNSSIKIDEYGLTIDYTKDGGLKINISISTRGLELLQALSFILCKIRNKRDYYHDYIISSYYRLIGIEIRSFSDESQAPLKRNKFPYTNNSLLICRIRDLNFNFCDVTKQYFLTKISRIEAHLAYEYEINHLGSKYLIPLEAINKSGVVKKKTMDLWLVASDGYLT